MYLAPIYLWRLLHVLPWADYLKYDEISLFGSKTSVFDALWIHSMALELSFFWTLNYHLTLVFYLFNVPNI